MRRALASYPPTIDLLLRAYEPVKGGQGRLVDIIVGFIDPNAPDVIAAAAEPEAGSGGQGRAGGRGRGRRRAPRTRKPSTPARTRKRPRAASPRSPSCTTRSSRRSTTRARRDPKTVKLRKKLAAEFMELKLAPQHVRRADRPAARAPGRDPRHREGDHGDLRARRRHAAQGLHRHLPAQRDQPALARQARARQAQALGGARPAARGHRAPAEEAARRSRSART